MTQPLPNQLRAAVRYLGRVLGDVIRAQDGQGLLRAYESIDKLERERILSFQYRRYHEAYVWFALAALACLVILVALEATLWRRVP